MSSFFYKRLLELLNGLFSFTINIIQPIYYHWCTWHTTNIVEQHEKSLIMKTTVIRRTRKDLQRNIIIQHGFPHSLSVLPSVNPYNFSDDSSHYRANKVRSSVADRSSLYDKGLPFYLVTTAF